jgi:hypothetical protein
VTRGDCRIAQVVHAISRSWDEAPLQPHLETRNPTHGLTPTPATPAQTETYLAGQNPASSLGGGFYAGKRASVSEGNQFEACTITF